MTDFTLGFNVDTRGLRDAGAEAKKAAREVGELSQAAERYVRSLEMEERAAKEFNNAQRSLNTALEKGKLDADQYARHMKGVEESFRRAQREAHEFRNAVNNSNTGLAGFGGKMQEAGGSITNAAAQIAIMRGALSGGAGGLAGGLEATGGMLARFGGGLSGVTAAAAGATAGVALLAAGYASAMFALAPYEDKLGQLEARLSNSLGSMSAAKGAMEALRKQTQETGLGFDAAADAFGRIARNNEAIGLTQQQMLDMVETVQKLGAASGASMGEMQAGMVQFGQALASGRLQGDELRSIMENFPALAKAIAENFEGADGKIGVTIGTLRRLGSEGELTGRKIADAVLRAQQQAREEYDKLPFTMERANQRLSDSYAQMLANMGRAFSSSAFVQGVYNFLNWVAEKVSGIFGRIAEANRQAEISRLTTEISTGTVMQSETSMARFGPLPQRALSTSEVADRRAQLARLQADGPALTPEQQRRKDEQTRLGASVGASDSIISSNLGARGQERRRNADVRQLTTAISDIDRLIALGGSEDYTVADLRAQRADAEAALRNVRNRKIGGSGGRTGGGARGPSSLETIIQQIEDMALSIAEGGGGGGTSIYGEALSSRRNDAKDKRAAELQRYINALTDKAVQAANTTSTELERQTAKQGELTRSVGASRDVIRELEVSQAAADFRFEHFGTITTPAVEEAVRRYTQTLRDNKKAIDETAAAQQVLDAIERAANAWEQTSLSGNPRAQRRAAFEASLNKELNAFGGTDEQRQQLIDNRESEFLAQEVAQQFKITEEQDRQLQLAERRLSIAGLSTREYEIQLRLLKMQSDLEAAGYNENDQFYKDTMAREEANARREQIITDEETRKRNFIRGWESAADKIGGLMSGCFDKAYEEGLGSAGNYFLKGMGNIFKEMGNQLVYELAIRPVVELARRLAELAAQKLIMSLFGGMLGGGGGGGTSLSLNTAVPSGTRYAAHGAAFTLGGLTAFARGGAFTNSIVDRPTLFAFAGGTGLMGEAGPEAIMPLKRGANGKLGVEGGSGGGETTIVINDMRSSAGAERVQTQEKRGADGKRMISVLIRDEVRRQIRSGDLDREMNSSYGATRTIARK